MSACFVCAAAAETAAHDHLPATENAERAVLGVLAGVVVAGPTRVLAGVCDRHTLMLWPIVARLRKLPDRPAPVDAGDPN